MKRIAIALLAALPLAAAADKLDCSIKAKKTDNAASLAKVNEPAARKSAIDSVKVKGATVVKGEIEVEDGCVVYTYDLSVPGKSGTQEVVVDAGNGNVLKSKHESAAKEAVEKAADKAKALGEKAKEKATGK
jgi:uncharacterized membrane protein YkoI